MTDKASNPRPTPSSGKRQDKIGALVIGGEYRGLGAVRSLGRHGIPVWVLTDEYRVAGSSRYAERRMPWPDGNDADRVAFLQCLAERYGLEGWVLFPTGDETAKLIAHNTAALGEHYRLTTPPWEMLHWAYDKRLTHEMAKQLGITCPWTCYPQRREDLESLDCVFPILLKPAYKPEINDFTRAKAWQVDNREQMLARYDEATQLVDADVIMLQQLIPGTGETQYSYGALCEDGRPLASIVARRTRQYPLDFGRASSYVETIEAPAVEELARTILKALNYTGLIEVEFKLDKRDCCFKLLDLNPRIWGWHTLGALAGVDFTYLQWRLARGEPVPEARARPGVRWVRLATDIPAAVGLMRQSRLSLVEYLRSLRGPLETAIFARDDPVPALLDFPLMVQVALKRRGVLV